MKEFAAKVLRHRAAPWVFWPLWVVLCYYAALLVTMAGVYLLKLLGLAGFVQTTGGMLGLEAVVYVIMLGLVLSLPYAKKQVTRKTLGIQTPLSWKELGLGIAGYVIYFLLFLVVTLLLKNFVPAYDASQTQDLGFTALIGTERIVAFVLFVVVAPLAEELIMRGFLFGKLREAKLSFWPAALIVSVLFGIAHGQWNVGVDTFILSMVACYLREVTGTIWPGVVIHMIKNFVAFMALFVWMLH